MKILQPHQLVLDFFRDGSVYEASSLPAVLNFVRAQKQLGGERNATTGVFIVRGFQQGKRKDEKEIFLNKRAGGRQDDKWYSLPLPFC